MGYRKSIRDNTLPVPQSDVKQPEITQLEPGTTAMLCPPQAPSPLIANWLARHRHLGSFALHMVGIPVSIVGILLLPIALPAASFAIGLTALGLFFAGYVFQFLGHALEGTDPGEVILLKRRLGWSYTEFAPQRAPASGGDHHTVKRGAQAG